MDSERRSANRRDVFRLGEIWLDHRPAPVDCLVRNTSSAGALIEVRTTGEVPDMFRLTIDALTLDCRCAVVRRSAHLLGVEFSD